MELIVAGCIGALTPELIRIAKGPTAGVFTAPGYWVQLFAQLVLSAVVAHYMEPKNAIEAFTFGFTAPQLATRLAAAKTQAPPASPPPGGGPPRFHPRIWWSR
jgi:hypothetical protein